MTNKEAIAILENLKIPGKTFFSQRLALDLAIKALEDRPTGKWLTDERGYVCSECGALHIDDYPFCHMCGVQMS